MSTSTAIESAAQKARDPLDYYRTDPAEVADWLRIWRPDPKRRIRTILEPAAGDGAFLGPLRSQFPRAKITARDIQPRDDGRHGIESADFFLPAGDDRYDLIISNPPYAAAEEFVQYALARANVYAVMLLRLGFIASMKRAALYKRAFPDLYVVARRPSFRAGTDDGRGWGTDNSDYAWFVWPINKVGRGKYAPRRRRHGRIQRIEAT